jgi:hypothetical protein
MERHRHRAADRHHALDRSAGQDDAASHGRGRRAMRAGHGGGYRRNSIEAEPTDEGKA